MPKGMHENERAYFDSVYFEHKEPASALDKNAIKKRKAEVIFEPHNLYSTDYFFFEYDDIKYFGRKTLSKLYLDKKQQSKKCSQIREHMILGMFIKDQVTEEGVMLFYRPLQNAEKVFLFDQIKINPMTEISFPYPYFKFGLKEYIQPDKTWTPSPEQVSNLKAGEEFIREHTVEFLKKFDLKGKKLFDPACSTGKFLGTVKEAYPEAYTIGQDLNSQMVSHAEKESKIDKIFLGDSQFTPLEDESVDFLFFRFLNMAVVSIQQANELFAKIGNRCKNGGYIIMFGHTPVILNSEWLEILGLEIEQKIAYSAKENSVFQYYILKKTGPIPLLNYDSFQVFNRCKLPEPLVTSGSNLFFSDSGAKVKDAEPRISCKM